MSGPSLRPLTPREEVVAGFFRREKIADGCMLLTAAAVGVCTGAFVHVYCSAGGAPAANTAASYCATVPQSHTWGIFGAIGLVIVLLLRGRDSSRRIVLAILVIAVIANGVVLLALPRCGQVTCSQ